MSADREALSSLLFAHQIIPKYDGTLSNHRCVWTACSVETDGGPNSPDNVRHITDAILGSDWLKALKADVWDEARNARAQYLGPEDGHYEDCMGYTDCFCDTYPNPYRESPA